MNIKNTISLFSLFASLCFSVTAFAATGVNCVSQLTDLDFIISSKNQGHLRFQNTPSEHHFTYQTDTSFNEYLDFSYQHILHSNPRAVMPCPLSTTTYKQLVKQGSRPEEPNIVDLIAPFELRQPDNQKAVLLVHGLTDSPFTYHDLAQVYFQQGYTVRTLLLPGHGTAPNALKDVNAQQWQQATDYAVNRTLKDFEQVVLGGYSTGAALLINYLTTRPMNEKIKALMLFSPASEPHNKNGWAAKWIDLIPFVNWIDEDADIDFAKYESFPWSAAAAADDAMRTITVNSLEQRKFPAIPVFTALSDIDTTIDSKATLSLLSTLHKISPRNTGNPNTLVLYGDKNIIPDHFPNSYTIYNPQCRACDCKGIQGISHIAVVNSPNNPHYGINANYRNCGSYLDDESTYRLCKTTAQITLGERTADNVARFQPFQRLTFNPYFTGLSNQITQFLNAVEQK
ncbi:alpha/beta hydrolase [Pseudoalteromonas atlantica]|uniref:alpha/beta hydrolase n=1 Tax=Pseudoalteromonas atlantica TaxID=288 RepID=UPI003736E709